mmetsp:Transcript_29325/g.84272  ORF Transcript_29325/g.84272 Transcript_29325/m.84272 type:complete len:236 (+) Transcript_29325:114-821(+)
MVRVASRSSAAASKAKLSLSFYEWGLLVAGDTFDVKDCLKEQGGKWDATRKAWAFKAEKKADVVEVLRAISGVDLDDKARAVLEVVATEDGQSFAVTGETFPVKALFRGLDGKWSRSRNGWLFPLSSLQVVRDALSASPDVGDVNDCIVGVGAKLRGRRGVKIAESACEQREQRQLADGTRETAIMQRVTNEMACEATGVVLEAQRVTRRRRIKETSHEIVETSTVTVRRVRRKV